MGWRLIEPLLPGLRRSLQSQPLRRFRLLRQLPPVPAAGRACGPPGGDLVAGAENARRSSVLELRNGELAWVETMQNNPDLQV